MLNKDFNLDKIVSKGNGKIFLYLSKPQIELFTNEGLIVNGKAKTYMGLVEVIQTQK